MQDLDCLLVYESGGKRTSVAFAARDGYGDRALAVIPTASPGDRGLLELTVRAKLPVRLIRAKLKKPIPAWADEATRTLVNGYESWSRSKEYFPREGQRKLNPALWFLRPYGKPAADYTGGRGRFHSWSLTYLRSAGHVRLLGSTDEHSGFTLFTVDWPRRCVRAAKECGGRFLEAGEEYRLLSLFAGEAPFPGKLFAAYARACPGCLTAGQAADGLAELVLLLHQGRSGRDTAGIGRSAGAGPAPGLRDDRRRLRDGGRGLAQSKRRFPRRPGRARRGNTGRGLSARPVDGAFYRRKALRALARAPGLVPA